MSMLAILPQEVGGPKAGGVPGTVPLARLSGMGGVGWIFIILQ